MYRWEGKIAVVTGASSGIGMAISKAFVQKGVITVGLARRKDKMEREMKDVNRKGMFYAVECDVYSKENVANVFQWIKKNVGQVQIMVNNAGVMFNKTILDTPRQEWETAFGVNVMGLLECTKHAVNMMKEADVEGHIININSSLGHHVHSIGQAKFSVHAGTKHAVTGLTESLRLELFGCKIRVTSISPGFVKTEMLEACNIDTNAMKQPALETMDVADAVVYVVSTPQRVEIKELMINPFTGL